MTRLFDGGLATELERRGADLSSGLWSAQALRDDPDLIRAVHEDFLRAGAEVITTASYQASIMGFERNGISRDEGEGLLRRSVRLAHEAIENVGGDKDRFVAASCGAYGAMLGGGREYDGDYGEIGDDELFRFHRRRLEVLLEERPSIAIFETIPRANEARVAAKLLNELGERGIISLQLSAPDRLGCGDDLDICVRELDASGACRAIGINCLPPSRATAALKIMRAATELPIVVQANSGEAWDGECWTPAEDGEDIVAEARRWLELGANGIGSCCRSGPEITEAMAGLLQD